MIGLFIDAAYANKTFGKNYIDYCAVRAMLEEQLGDKVDSAYYFTAKPAKPSGRTAYVNSLSKAHPSGPGLRVKEYWTQTKLMYWPNCMGGKQVLHPETKQPYRRTTQKAVDVGLVYHLTRSYQKRAWDKLVLFAGDADFHEPIQDLVESEGVDLYLMGTLDTISSSIAPYAREIFEVNSQELQERLKLK